MAPIMHFQVPGRGLAHTVVERRSPQAGVPPFWLVDVDILSRRAKTPVALGSRDTVGSSSGQAAGPTPSLQPSIEAFVGAHGLPFNHRYRYVANQSTSNT